MGLCPDPRRGRDSHGVSVPRGLLGQAKFLAATERKAVGGKPAAPQLIGYVRCIIGLLTYGTMRL